jgi:large subunit ribosomal protein L25
MAEVTTIEAAPRAASGTGAARAERRDGRVPCIVYGGGAEPAMITVEGRMIERHANSAGFFSHLYDLKVDGQTVRVLPRDLQRHPVTDRTLHVDFLRVAAGSQIEVAVPVHFINHEASPGLKRGGLLNVVRHELQLYVAADSIPESITIDLTGRNIGDSIHISHVTLPPGSTPTITDRDFTVATIVAPTVAREEATAAGAEGAAT